MPIPNPSSVFACGVFADFFAVLRRTRPDDSRCEATRAPCVDACDRHSNQGSDPLLGTDAGHRYEINQLIFYLQQFFPLSFPNNASFFFKFASLYSDLS